MNIATVVEGPTDRLVLQAVLDGLFPGEHRYFPLQPSVTFGEMGTGWKGVRRWCRETWQRESDLSQLLSNATGVALDLLVIHIDADVAAEPDLQEGDAPIISDVAYPCPPITATVEQLRKVVLRWLHLDIMPPQVILAVPAQDTENWTFAALFSDDPLCARPDYECTHKGQAHPGFCLTLKKYGRLLRRADRRIQKPQRDYARVVPHIVANWSRVREICSQAEQFTLDAQTCLQVSENNFRPGG